MSKEKKAVEVVEGKGVSVPIYEAFVKRRGKNGEELPPYEYYLVSYYQAEKRILERAKSLAVARKRAQAIIDERAGGMLGDSILSAQSIKQVHHAYETLKPLNIKLSEAASRLAEAERILNGKGTVQEAARMYAKRTARDELIPITFGELYKEFMATLATEGTAKTREYNWSYRYWQDCSQRLGAAAEVFKNKQVSDITARDLEAFLDKCPIRRRTAKGVVFNGKFRRIEGRTRNNYKGAFCTIFSYARNKKYIPWEGQTEAERISTVGEKAPRKGTDLKNRVYTAEEMQTILENLPTKWIPLVLLGAFAGIRTAEIRRLEWRDVNWQSGNIELERDRTKMGRRRYLQMSKQIQAWLKPIAKKEGWIIPHHAQDSTTGIEFGKWRNRIPVRKLWNGCRDSYASYRLCEIQDAGRVALEMGTGTRMLDSNYGSLVDSIQLAAWKKVLPKNGYPASSDKNAERLKAQEKASAESAKPSKSQKKN